MDHIIDKISEIEANSNQILEEANSQKGRIASDIKEATAVFDRQLDQETQTQLDALHKKLKAEMEKKLADQRTSVQEIIDSMENHYEQKRSGYIEQLFSQMTGE